MNPFAYFSRFQHGVPEPIQAARFYKHPFNSVRFWFLQFPAISSSMKSMLFPTISCYCLLVPTISSYFWRARLFTAVFLGLKWMVKIVSKSIPNRPKNRPQIDPKSVQNRPQIILKWHLGASIDFSWFWDQFGTTFWTHFGTIFDQKRT